LHPRGRRVRLHHRRSRPRGACGQGLRGDRFRSRRWPGPSGEWVRTDRGTISSPQVVCAAGAWSGLIGQMAGVDLPVKPLRREIMVSEPVDFDTTGMPFTIDFSTSYYVHPEGSGLLFGCPDEVDDWSFNDKRDPDWPSTLAEH